MITNNNHIVLIDAIEESALKQLKKQIDECSGVAKYRLASEYRMLKAWNLFLSNAIYKSDFECAARDYLIVNNAELKIPQYSLSDYADHFGLEYEKDKEQLTARHCYPKYISSTFLNSAFIQGAHGHCDSKEVNLETNSFVRDVSGFEMYKSDEQKLAVIGSLKAPDGYTTLVSMTTGGGKSLVTQAVAYQKQGLTIVIVPTVSLMLDQVRNIKCKNKNEVLYYNASSGNLSQIEAAIKDRSLRILYMSPEALIRNKKLHDLIEAANEEAYLKNLVIDEAHMVMEWGALFRVDFQCLDIVRKELLSKNPTLRTYLLSATFSEEVVRLLKLTYSEGDKWIEIRCDKLRKEPRFSFIKTSEIEKVDKTVELICSLPHPMIVYVRNPDQAEAVKTLLSKHTGMNNIKTFTGTTNSDKRNELINGWTNDDFSIMIATCAFGVGVDKKDVRTVLHVHVPENANNYYQEAGRGGRDGLPCLSVILYSNEDIDNAYNYIQKVLTTEKLTGRWFSMLEKASPKGGGKFVISSTVKPKYHVDDGYVPWVNEGDVTWNVYVILFLKRCGLLTVDSMKYDESTKYTFEITLLDSAIRNSDSSATELLDACRREEYERNICAVKKMGYALRNASKQCIASLFNEVYGRTDEYCAGCDAHSDIHNYQNDKPLLGSLNSQIEDMSEQIRHIMHGATNKFVITKDLTQHTINNLAKIGVNAFVGPLNIKYFCDEHIKYPTMIAFEYKELFEYADKGRMYLSGCIAVILPIYNQELLVRILSVCKQLNARYGISFIFLAETNDLVTKHNKLLSELIEGQCVKAYIFEEECKNV